MAESGGEGEKGVGREVGVEMVRGSGGCGDVEYLSLYPSNSRSVVCCGVSTKSLGDSRRKLLEDIEGAIKTMIFEENGRCQNYIRQEAKGWLIDAVRTLPIDDDSHLKTAIFEQYGSIQLAHQLTY